MSVFGDILIRIFPHSNWIRRDTPNTDTFYAVNSSRKRKITLFNPPFNSNVSTYVTKTFLKLIDKHFARSQKLNKIVNRKTIKISYNSMEKLKKIIKEHNKKFTINNTKIQQDCNWRIKKRCSIIYECTACTKYNPKKAYLWLTKKRA